MDLFEKFKREVLQSANWAMNLKLSFFSHQVFKAEVKKEATLTRVEENDEEEVEEDALYLLHTIEVEGKKYGVA